MADDRPLDFGGLVRYWAERRGGHTALDDGIHRIDYAALDRLSLDYAEAMRAAGLVKGDRISWLGKNANLYFVLLIAASRSGLVMAPLGWRLTAPEIRYILKDTGTTLLVFEPGFTDLARKATEGVESVKHLVCTGHQAGFVAFDDWIHSLGKQPLEPVDIEDTVLQLYTSGTTGHPKGVLLNNRNLFGLKPGMVGADHEWANMHEGDIYLGVMPVAHIAGTGQYTIPLWSGAAYWLRPEFDAEQVLDAINRGVTHHFLVPTALQMVIDHPKARDTDFSGLRRMMYGAAPIPLELLRRAVEMMEADFTQHYGMTETTGTAVLLPASQHDPKGNPRMRAAGKALPGVEAMIVGPDRRELPRGEIGEVCIRGSCNTVGYWNNPEKTAETIDPDGWLHTGDAAYMDEEGYIFIQDRLKDMIISGAENIYPAEVENAIFGHPDVREVAVIGVPDEKWGEAVKAVVSAKPGHQIDPASVIAWARERIAAFKAPKSVDVVDELPRSSNGKILRRELRDPYWVGRERRVN